MGPSSRFRVAGDQAFGTVPGSANIRSPGCLRSATVPIWSSRGGRVWVWPGQAIGYRRVRIAFGQRYGAESG
jgi:hypothetical protein